MASAQSSSGLIQRLLLNYETPSYLEIGVAEGATFLDVKAVRKVAVDPSFRFPLPDDPSAAFFACGSDDYFQSINGGEMFDVIFVDGLHQFEQALRDLLNAVACLKPRGVIVVDDIFPSSYLASLGDQAKMRAMRDRLDLPRGDWMGDVYKVAAFIERFMPAFAYASTPTPYSQLIMWRGGRDSFEPAALSSVSNLDYADVIVDAIDYRRADLEDILARIAKHVRD